jgi:hypothetical protein
MSESPPLFSLPLVTDLEPWMLGLLFVVTFFGTLLFVPWVVVRLPADYFQYRKRHPVPWGTYHPVLRALFLVGKNLLGLLLVLTGLAMLVLPGQGLLTMLIGIMLLDFPGKFRCERWLVRRKPVLRAVNWLRIKRHRAPFDLD